MTAFFKNYANRDWIIIGILVLVYFISGKLGLQLALFNPSATPVWPPTGITIAAFLLFGFRIWPAIFVGAFFVNLTTAGNVATSLGIALGNTLEGVIAAYLVQRFASGVHAFERPSDVLKYTLFAGLVGTFVSAIIGVNTLKLFGFVPQGDFWPVFFTWWLGDIGGALVVGPTILLFKNQRLFSWNLNRFLELALVFSTLILTALLIFSGFLPDYFNNYPLVFLVIPILIYTALRFGLKETAAGFLLFITIAVIGTVQSAGPFATEDPNRSLVLIQVFVAIVFLTVMPHAAAIYQQKKTSNSLRQSEERWEALVTSVGDGLIVTDDEGRIIFINYECQRLLGWDIEELKNKQIIEYINMYDEKGAIVPPENRPIVIALKTGNKVKGKYVYLRKDKKKIWIGLVVTPILLNGEITGAIQTMRDITREEEIDQKKSEFISLAAHQLRTPLTIVNWYTESLLKKGKKIPKVELEDIGEIRKASKKMSSLVSSLLNVSRIELGVFSVKPSEVDIVKIIKNEIQSLKPPSALKDFKITQKYSSKKITVNVDPNLMQIIFQNLLSNSIKYTPKGGKIAVSISDDRKSGKDEQILISVSDSGYGIPKDAQPKVFTKLFRAPNVSEIETEGSGLGLYIVKSILDQTGGKIWFESKEGKGTTFFISIPKAGMVARVSNKSLAK